MTIKGQQLHQEAAPTPAHRAPLGQFRVIACDTFEGPFADTLVGDFTKLDAAVAAASVGPDVTQPGVQVTLAGSFAGTSTVKFGTTSAAVVSSSANEIVVNVPSVA